LYTNNCAFCHGADPSKNLSNILNGKSASVTLNAIATNFGNMGFLSATIKAAEADNIAAYLATISAVPTTPTTPTPTTPPIPTPTTPPTPTPTIPVTPTSTTPPPTPVTGSVAVGQSLYSANCAFCHGVDATKNLSNIMNGKNASVTLNAIATNFGNMGFLSGTIKAAEANSIAAYLTSLVTVSTPGTTPAPGTTPTSVTTTAPSPTPATGATPAPGATTAPGTTTAPAPTPAPAGPRGISSLNGQALWSAISPVACASCHGAKPDTDMAKIWNASGTAADQGEPGSIRRGIQGNAGGMGFFSGVSDPDLADIAAYVNAVRYGKVLTNAPNAVVSQPFVLWQNGAKVNSITLAPVMFGSASSVRTTIAIQAPAGSTLRIDGMSIDNRLFTLNSVPAAIADRIQIDLEKAQNPAVQQAGTTGTVAVITTTGLACPAGAFELQAGAACGLEVVMAVTSPGEVKANLQLRTGATEQPPPIAIEAVVTAQATGGAGGGGCTMRSAPGLFDPMLLLLSALSLGILGLRRNKKPQA
jgi:mono/diheme cytochrome c family protein